MEPDLIREVFYLMKVSGTVPSKEEKQNHEHQTYLHCLLFKENFLPTHVKYSQVEASFPLVKEALSFCSQFYFSGEDKRYLHSENQEIVPVGALKGREGTQVALGVLFQRQERFFL